MTKEEQHDWGKADPAITYEGTMITLPDLPEKMPLKAAISALERLKKDEEQELDVFEILDAYPEDALVALNAAMREVFGWASPVPKMSFFGPIPPDLVTVKVGPKDADSVQVPYGCFSLPGVENSIEVVRSATEAGPVLVVRGSVRKREASIVRDLANVARKILKERSIYKGKAINLRVDSGGNLSTDTPPNFLETDYIVPEDLILNDIELEQIKSTLWAPVEHTAACVAAKIPLNRGILLEGIYGTGKTMAATVTSKICVDNGWTYILLDDVRALKDALIFAQRYQPAVVFAEDVDRVADVRDQRGNDILNTIDGVLTKNAQVITVLTTNHVDKLDRAMLRPGRLDAVISIRPPEGEAVERLIKLYARNLLDEGSDLSGVAEVIGGNIPATIREVVERSKLSMIYSSRSRITADDLLVAAHGMAGHLALLAGNKPAKPLTEQFGEMFGKMLSEYSDVSNDDATLKQLAGQVQKSANSVVTASASLSKAAQRGSKLAEQVDEIHSSVV